jgi:hypothetical protein
MKTQHCQFVILSLFLGVSATACNSPNADNSSGLGSVGGLGSGTSIGTVSSVSEKSAAAHSSLVLVRAAHAPATQPSAITGPSAVCLKDSISIIALAGTIKMAASDRLEGDVVALDNSVVQIAGDAHIDGTLYLDAGAQSEGDASAVAGGTVQGDISESQALIIDFITSLTSLSPTQEYDHISSDKTLQSTGRLNVVAINDFALSAGQKLTLHGEASDIFILNIGGNVSIGDRSGIVLAGGLMPTNVIINNLGSGRDIQIGVSDEIDGTVIAYNRGINVGGNDTIRGTLIAGDGVAMNGGNSSWSPQGFCTER